MQATTLISPSDQLFTVNEAAEYMRCSTFFLYRLRKEGKLKTGNAGKKVLIRKSDIDSYLNIHNQGGENGQ